MTTNNEIQFKDHIVANPYRYKRVPVAGTTDQFDMIPTWVDNPSEIVQLGTAVDRQLFEKLRGNVTRRSQQFTATANQTVFTLAHAYLVDQGRLDVFVNGVKKRSGTDFTETSPTSFTMSAPLSAGAAVEAVYFSANQAMAEDLIEQVQAAEAAIMAAETATQEAQTATAGALSANLTWKDPVASLTALNALTGAQTGDTRQTRDTGYVYRYNGTAWAKIQEMDPNAITALDTRLTSQLAEKAQQTTLDNLAKLNSMVSYLEFGEIEMPTGFPALPFSVWRDSEGKLQHNYLPPNFTGATQIYLDFVNGNDVSWDGLSQSTPVKTMTKAIQVANAQASANIIINILSITDDFRNSHASTAYTMTKNTLIRASNAKNKTVMMSGYPNASSRYAWLADGAAWKVARTNVKAVYDSKFTDYRGHSKKLKLVASAAVCKQQKGSYYTDGVDVWINLPDGRNPTNDYDVQVVLETTGDKVMFVANGKKLMFENIEFLSRAQNADAVRVNGDSTTEVCVKNCFFAEGNLNGFYTNSCERVYVLDSDASYNGYDGFNYKGPAVASPTIMVFESNCHAHDNGFSQYYSCNASTAHNGIYVLRLGTVGYRCHGSIIADVNGCFSVNYDCVAYDSTVPIEIASNGKAAFYFDERQALKEGKSYLFNCKGGGQETDSIDSDDMVEINVRNFSGSSVRPDLNFNVLT